MSFKSYKNMDLQSMGSDQLERYIQMGKHVEECKAEWLRRHEIDYPFAKEGVR